MQKLLITNEDIEDLLFVILEFNSDAVSFFGIKVITKKMTLFTLYLLYDISSFKSEKGDNIKLSRTCFFYKQKR